MSKKKKSLLLQLSSFSYYCQYIRLPNKTFPEERRIHFFFKVLNMKQSITGQDFTAKKINIFME